MTPSAAEYQEAAERIEEVRRKAKEAWKQGKYPRQKTAAPKKKSMMAEWQKLAEKTGHLRKKTAAPEVE